MGHTFQAVAFVVATVLWAGGGSAQTVVVGPGQTLTRDDLDAGIFNGQPFVLGPGATFEVAGGTFGLAFAQGQGLYDLRGSAVRVTDEGRFIGDIARVSLIIDGGVDIEATVLESSCVLVSGSIDMLLAEATDFRMTGGRAWSLQFDNLFISDQPSFVQIDGGTVSGGIDLLRGAGIVVNDGLIDDIGIRNSFSNVTINGGQIQDLSVRALESSPHAERPSTIITGGTIGQVFAERFERFVMTGGTIETGLRLFGGSNFEAFISRADLLGGAINNEIEAFGSIALTIDGTAVAGDVVLSDSPELASIVVRSGSVSGMFVLTDAPTLIAGGTIESIISARGLLLTITGGDIRNGFRSAGLTTVAGGAIDGPIDVGNFTTLVLNAESAAIDGAPLPLISGEPLEVVERKGATLTAVLADGSPFQIDLNGERVFPNDFVSPNARLIVLKGDRPCVPDINLDGTVNQSDVNLLVDAFLISDPTCDQNGDGLCTPADFNAWIINANAGC